MSSPFEAPDLRTTDTSRSVQDALIVSFVAILCSYYWITSAWPYIQGNLELRREKLSTMEKLKRKQIPEINGDLHLISPSQASEKKDNKRANAVAVKYQLQRPEAKCDIKSVEDILVPLGGEYILEDSDATLIGIKTTLNGEQISNADHEVVTKQENSGKSLAGPSNLGRDFGDRNKCAEKKELGGKSVVKTEDKLEDLWSHISRTSGTLCGAVCMDAPLNPWTSPPAADAESNASEGATSESVSREMHSTNRDLRAQQDADYSASLAADKERDASVLRILKNEDALAIEMEKRLLKRRAIAEALADEPEEDVEGVLTLAFRFQFISREQSDGSSSFESMDSVSSPNNAEKATIVRRRFSCYHSFSLLFDFIETHDLCPLEYVSLEILLFHPKRSFTRGSFEGILHNQGIVGDTVVWVRIETE